MQAQKRLFVYNPYSRTIVSSQQDRIIETKYQSFFQAPEKKPLVRRDPTEDVQAKVRKGSQKIHANPVAELEEFMGGVNQQETI